MTKDGNGKLEKRMTDLEGQFAAFEKERKELVENRAKVDRRLSEIRDAMISLDARYGELKAMADEDKPKPTIPKKK